MPKDDLSQLQQTGPEESYVFTVAAYPTYQTIHVSNYYVTFNPETLEDNLPANQTNDGPHEKFIFTSCESI